MSIFNFGGNTLTKFTIYAYTDDERTKTACELEAMFNPETLTTKFSTKYDEPQGLIKGTQSLGYANNPPEEMKVKLILDNYYILNNSIKFTGKKVIISKENIYSLSADDTKSNISATSQWVKCFLEYCWIPYYDIHQPLFLKVVWGGVNFPCRLSSVDIKYTRFDRKGKPTAAELDIALKGDCSKKREILVNNFTSPDLTHMRIVKSGDTLPLLCQQIYGDSSYYPTVAQANGLDNFRNLHLQLGQKLYFPPLT